MRKIIQITASTLRKTVGLISEDFTVLIALCDDGTLWQMGENGWAIMEAIPQGAVLRAGPAPGAK